MGLEGIVKGERKPPRLTLYGAPKVGKSTFAGDSPNPVFVTTEDGVDNLPVAQFPAAKNWKELLDRVRQVATQPHDHKTIVIDTLNGAVELAAQHVCDKMYGGQWTAKGGNGGFLAWGQGWRATSEEVRALLAALDDCRTKGMMVVLLAHTGLQTVKHPSEGDYSKFAPDIEKPVWARIAKWCDIIMRADYETTVLRQDRGKAKVISSSTRYVTTEGSNAMDAGCRVGYELPARFPLMWGDFDAAMGKENVTQKEIGELWGILNEDERKKTIAWLGVDKIEDAPLTKARQLLDRLKAKKAAQDAEKEEK
jgi:hypothetical protein